MRSKPIGHYRYDVVAGCRRHPQGVMACDLTLAEARAIKADYSHGRGYPRYIKRIWVAGPREEAKP
jgi:hypothetical protein